MAPARRFLLVLALSVVWTGFVWATRIRNALDDASLTGATRSASIALASALLALAAAAGATGWRRTGPWAVLARAHAAATVVVWAVRVPQIWLTEHPGVSSPVGFNVVHTVLGVVSVALAAGVWRTLPAARGADGSDGSGRSDRSDRSGGGDPVAPGQESPAPAGRR